MMRKMLKQFNKLRRLRKGPEYRTGDCVQCHINGGEETVCDVCDEDNKTEKNSNEDSEEN